MNQQNFGKKILELRQSRGLTQGELADSCNLSLRTIQRIESAEVTPRSHTIKVILSNLGVNPDTNALHFYNETYRKPIETKNRFGLYLEFMQEKLKSNTVKKLSALFVLIFVLGIGYFYNKEADRQVQAINGWSLAGSKARSYSIGIDKAEYISGESSAFLESNEKDIEGFGTLSQSTDARRYLGNKVKMTAYIKSEDVSNWAGMWLRIDSKNHEKRLAFDNMQDRKIVGDADWQKYEIILNVPRESATLNYGFLLSGTGIIWIDDIKFELLGSSSQTLTTGKGEKNPYNLGFDD